MPGVRETAERVRASPAEALALLTDTVSAIEELDPELRAWVHLDRDGAAAGAQRLLGGGRRSSGTLAGVPVGVKDIIDVAAVPTRAGAASFAHRTPARDAAVVGRLRRAGALIMGKTATTEFAYSDPAETRNPWNPGHTPGGSSSGSAAAVAAGMVPAALGTQTIGSVLRPAAYCGIVGFKPSFRAIGTDGVVPLAWSFDHVGVLARSVDDAEIVFSAVSSRGRRGRDVRDGDLPAGLRLGFLEDLTMSRAVPEAALAVSAVARKLEAAGAIIERSEMAHPAEWLECGRTIMASEAATFHQDAFAANQAEYGEQIALLVSTGLSTPAPAYIRALHARDALKAEARALFRNVDALILPTAPAPAPQGLGSTGDPALCAPASFSGLPSISLPTGLDRSGLPLAVQLVGGPGGDRKLLAIAASVERILAFDAHPPLFATVP